MWTESIIHMVTEGTLEIHVAILYGGGRQLQHIRSNHEESEAVADAG